MEWFPDKLTSAVTTEDGERIPMLYPVMCRKRADGSLEYRKMTEAEEADFMSSDAW